MSPVHQDGILCNKSNLLNGALVPWKSDSFCTVHKLLPQSSFLPASTGPRLIENRSSALGVQRSSGFQAPWGLGAKLRERNMRSNNDCEKSKMFSVLPLRLLTCCPKGTKRWESGRADYRDKGGGQSQRPNTTVRTNCPEIQQT